MDCCPITARHVCREVTKRAQRFDARTKLNDDRSSCIQEYQWKDLVVGQLLGQGTFSSVYQVTIDEKEYALKLLRKRCMANKESFTMGAVDLVMESKLLQRLRHPNIVRLYGTKGGCLSRSFLESGYFLVLERLYGTLEERLRHWDRIQKNNKSATRRQVQGETQEFENLSNGNERHDSVPPLLERIRVIALGIASAMEYLHGLSICVRDLKPVNVGFAKDGTVRLFDFGLALELPAGTAITTSDTSATTVRQHDISGQVGTARYMAPENALCNPYGLPCDVYSFGLILWEICTLKVAYKKLTPSQHAERVVFGKGRPPLKMSGSAGDNRNSTSFSPSLSKLLQDCWQHEPQRRPDFTTICHVLEKEQQSRLYVSNSANNIVTTSSSTEPLQKQVDTLSSSRSRRARLLACLLPSQKQQDQYHEAMVISKSAPSTRHNSEHRETISSVSFASREEDLTGLQERLCLSDHPISASRGRYYQLSKPQQHDSPTSLSESHRARNLLVSRKEEDLSLSEAGVTRRRARLLLANESDRQIFLSPSPLESLSARHTQCVAVPTSTLTKQSVLSNTSTSPVSHRL